MATKTLTGHFVGITSRNGAVVKPVSHAVQPKKSTRAAKPKAVKGNWLAVTSMAGEDIFVRAYFTITLVECWTLPKRSHRLALRLENCINDGKAFTWDPEWKLWSPQVGSGRYLSSDLKKLGY